MGLGGGFGNANDEVEEEDEDDEDDDDEEDDEEPVVPRTAPGPAPAIDTACAAPVSTPTAPVPDAVEAAEDVFDLSLIAASMYNVSDGADINVGAAGGNRRSLRVPLGIGFCVSTCLAPMMIFEAWGTSRGLGIGMEVPLASVA